MVLILCVFFYYLFAFFHKKIEIKNKSDQNICLSDIEFDLASTRYKRYLNEFPRFPSKKYEITKNLKYLVPEKYLSPITDYLSYFSLKDPSHYSFLKQTENIVHGDGRKTE